MKKVRVPLFNFSVYFSNDIDETTRFVEKNCGDEKTLNTIKDALEDSLGVTITFNDKEDRFTRVLGVFNGEVGTAAHESVHVAYSIIRGAGIDITEENHEVLAYLTDWLLTQFMKRYKLEVECKKPSGCVKEAKESRELTAQRSLESIPTQQP